MALCPVLLFNWAIAAGNNTPSLVSCWHHHLCTAGNSGTAAIWPQRKRADAFLVSGATERHPARWPSWGRSHFTTGGPFFRGALIATVHRNVNGLSPIFCTLIRDVVSHTNGYFSDAPASDEGLQSAVA